MASSSSTGEGPPLVTTEAKMVVATGRDHCQQLKDMLSKEDTWSMVVVAALSNQTSIPNPRSAPVVMDPGLLAVACSGSWKKLQSFLNGDPSPTSSDGNIRIRCCCCSWKKRQALPHPEPRPTSSNGTTRSSAIQQPSHDQEALLRLSFLDGVTVAGDTFLHVMATNSVEEDLVEDGPGLICSKAVQRLFVRNNNGDTPLHCAARAEKSQMVTFLVDLARGNDANTVKALLEKQNNRRWTVLHEAVRAGNNHIVKLLMEADPELASFPQDGTSPLYLAILLENKIIAKTLYEKSKGILSYSGPNGQNALHAAVLRGKDLAKMLLEWNNALTRRQDENGSTPLHMAASMRKKGVKRTMHLLLLEANPDQLYQPDNDGLFPIHVAASIDATPVISDFLKKSPSCAGLRDARGRTYLHVAVDKKKTGTVSSTCRNQSLSWILNMQDNDGNTALHLAVQKGSLRMFCALFGNSKIQLNLTNEKGETPLDVASRSLTTAGMYTNQNSEAKIHCSLKIAGAKWGICRHDHYTKDDTLQAEQDQKHQIEMVKDSTQSLCIGSVLIATVAFGATFAMPGGYRADDHTNGGTPTLAGRYGFDAFIMTNTLAFSFSVMAVISLMASGSPVYNLRSRVKHVRMAFTLMQFSVVTLVIAFALGASMMLAPVTHKSALAVSVISSFVYLYATFEGAITNAMVMSAFIRRLGMSHNIGVVLMYPLSALTFVGILLIHLLPILIGLTALNYTGPKVETAAQPPAPFA